MRERSITRVVVATALVACLLRPAWAAGMYGPLPIHHSEEPLMASAAGYEEMFLRRGYRYESPELEDFVSRVGAALAPKPTDPYIRYRFHILRDVEPNAFALPDGQVYVNSGMLALLDNEAELAALLGHETSHTAGHHGILEYRKVRGAVIGERFIGTVLGPLALQASDLFLGLAILGYSRDLEEEADRRGVAWMFEAGYDPREASRLEEALLADPEDERPHRSTAWSTHPQHQARVEYTRAMAAGLLTGRDAATLRVDADSYRRRVRRLCFDTVRDLIDADYPRSAFALALRLVGEWPSDPATHIALGDAARALGARAAPAAEGGATDKEKKANLAARENLTRGEREARRLATLWGQDNLRTNLATAIASYRRALEIAEDLPDAHRGLGLALEQQGDLETAGKELVIYLRATPKAPDESTILDHLKQLTAAIKMQAQSQATPGAAAPTPAPTPAQEEEAPHETP